MNKYVSRGLWFALFVGGLTLGGTAAANAATTSGADGTVSGTQVAPSVDAPVSLGGNAIGVLGDAVSTVTGSAGAAPGPGGCSGARRRVPEHLGRGRHALRHAGGAGRRSTGDGRRQRRGRRRRRGLDERPRGCSGSGPGAGGSRSGPGGSRSEHLGGGRHRLRHPGRPDRDGPSDGVRQRHRRPG
ncbi:hypothetical protein Q9Q99_07175 [Curtobacterium flaccumfaciens]|nr:hypothetical protein Q9Q99_07175 [Curtobacterium flaccumfaciens]